MCNCFTWISKPLILGSCLCVYSKIGSDPLVTDPRGVDSEQIKPLVCKLVHFNIQIQILILIVTNQKPVEAVSAALHQINLFFCVLITSLLGDTIKILTHKDRQSGGGSKFCCHKVGPYVCVLARHLLEDTRFGSTFQLFPCSLFPSSFSLCMTKNWQVACLICIQNKQFLLYTGQISSLPVLFLFCFSFF